MPEQNTSQIDWQSVLSDIGERINPPAARPNNSGYVRYPKAQVPGARKKPSKAYRRMASEVQAITDILPYYQQAIRSQIGPNAQAELEAQKTTSPQLAQLMTELYRTYGSQMNDIGNEISRRNALYQADTDRQVLEGPGMELIAKAKEAAQLYDPEYFATRRLTSDKLNELLNSIQLGSGLSPTERMEIERSQAQQGGARGTYRAPSNLDTVSNAMQFGQAGFNRIQSNRSALSDAIAKATGAIPTFNSGTDVFKVATGKDSKPNTGDARFTGVNDLTKAITTSNASASNLAGNLNQLDLGIMNIDANKKDWADYMNQVTSSIGDIAGAVGGMCYIARRVYGWDNIKWLQFRHWLFNTANSKTRNFYINNAAKIADNLKQKQINKLRQLMDSILKEAQYVN